MWNFWRKKTLEEINPKIADVRFDIPYERLYNADGNNEGLTLSADEVSALLDYIQHMTWLTNQPKKK